VRYGQHERFLPKDVIIDSIDLQLEFVEVAWRKVGSGRVSVADMRSLDLSKTYDFVQCLLSSIGYLTQPKEVVSALRAFKKHLNPQGVVIIEPWLSPEGYVEGVPHMAPLVDLPDLKIVRMNVTEKEGNLSLLRFYYLIARTKGIENVCEDHELALYSVDELKSFFTETGLSVEHHAEGIFGRGLYIARDAASR
jgi:hypothetical protein